MRVKVILADNDKEYIKHFTNTIQMYYKDSIELVTFSNEESFRSYIKSNKPYDIVLMTQDFMSIDLKKNSTVLLSDTNGIKEENGIRAIGKYQRINKIHDEIIDIFSEIKATMKMNNENSAESHFVGFTSTAGGTGKTTVSIAYARKMVEKGYQVLYLSLDNFSTINNLFSGKGEYTFSNVIFVLKRSNDHHTYGTQGFRGVCYNYDSISINYQLGGPDANGTYGDYKSPNCSHSFCTRWFYSGSQWIPPVTHDEYRYSDRTKVYTYTHRKVEQKESKTNVTASDSISNVKHWVKYVSEYQKI